MHKYTWGVLSIAALVTQLTVNPIYADDPAEISVSGSTLIINSGTIVRGIGSSDTDIPTQYIAINTDIETY
jgi:hypothetical protein